MSPLDLPKPYYEEDGITIYCGDCVEILPRLPGKFDLCITDPPYFQPATHYCPTRDQGTPKKSIGDMSILELAFKRWCELIVEQVSEDGTIYFFCDGQSYPIAFTALYPYAKHVRLLIWDKVVSFNGYTWRHQHELIAWAEMPKAKRVPTGDGDILACRAVPVDKRLHPAEKPSELIRRLAAKHTGTRILDPFSGSGTTLRAAKDFGCQAVGVEISEEYCEIAANRLQQGVLPFDR